MPSSVSGPVPGAWYKCFMARAVPSGGHVYDILTTIAVLEVQMDLDR